MKKTTEIILDRELRSGKYYYGDNSGVGLKFDELFTKYIMSEFDSVDDFYKAFNVSSVRDCEFYKFVFGYTNEFGISKKALKESGYDSPELLVGQDLAMVLRGVIINNRGLKNIEKFVNMALGVTSGGMLLDVGSGTIMPDSSLVFAKNLGEVYSMDKFYLDDLNRFEKLGVHLLNEYFDNNTDISRFDRIVTKAGCTAIKPIVEQCANQDSKEYFIEMCDCCSPRNGLTGFVEYLKEKDKSLRHFVVRQEYDMENYWYKKEKQFFINKVGELVKGEDTVYVTNSSKHNDDIKDIIYRQEMGI